MIIPTGTTKATKSTSINGTSQGTYNTYSTYTTTTQYSSSYLNTRIGTGISNGGTYATTQTGMIRKTSSEGAVFSEWYEPGTMSVTRNYQTEYTYLDSSTNYATFTSATTNTKYYIATSEYPITVTYDTHIGTTGTTSRGSHTNTTSMSKRTASDKWTHTSNNFNL